MHYKNGRPAKNGDKVMVFPGHGAAFVGVMYDSVAGNDFCNGKVAVISAADPMINLQEALHFDDVKGLIPVKTALQGNVTGLDLEKVPDTSKA
jgi:hypothetical protein